MRLSSDLQWKSRWSENTYFVECGLFAHPPSTANKTKKGVNGSFGLIRWAPQQARVYNPAFDVTPSSLVTSLILDTGVYTQEQLGAGVLATLKQFKHGSK